MKYLIGKLPDCPLEFILEPSDSWNIFQSLEIQTEAGIKISQPIAYWSASRCV